LTASTSYSFTVKAKDAANNISAASAALSVTTAGVSSYCTSKGSSYAYEWIAGVKVGGTTKTSTASGYSDFTSAPIAVVQGSNSVTLTPGFASSTYTEYWVVWIDFNNNQSFTDAGEQVFSGNGKSAVTGTITIPSAASGTARMRVSMKYNAAPTSCETFSYGEVEDYTVTFGGTIDTQAPTVPVGLTASSITQTSCTLSWTASTDNVGVTGYDVYRGTTLAGSTATTSYSATGLAVNTAYSFTVKAKDAAGNVSAASSALLLTTLGGTVTYCTPSHSSPTGYFYISNVTMGGINNTSALGNSTTCYSNYTTIVANLVKGSTYTLSEAFTPSWSGNSGAAWIDWNGDGDFDDSGERVMNIASSTSPYTATVAVPSTAVTGSTRMRVRLTYSGTLTPCGVMYYGETEDYTVNIAASGSSGPLSTPAVEFSVYPNPNDGSFKVMLPGLGEEVVVNAYNMSGQLLFHTAVRLNEWPTEVPATLEAVPGVYTIQVITSKAVVSKRIIVK